MQMFDDSVASINAVSDEKNKTKPLTCQCRYLPPLWRVSASLCWGGWGQSTAGVTRFHALKKSVWTKSTCIVRNGCYVTRLIVLTESWWQFFFNNIRRYCRQLRLAKLQRRYHSICKHANFPVISVIYFICIRKIKHLHDKTCLLLALVCQIIGFFLYYNFWTSFTWRNTATTMSSQLAKCFRVTKKCCCFFYFI